MGVVNPSENKAAQARLNIQTDLRNGVQYATESNVFVTYFEGRNISSLIACWKPINPVPNQVYFIIFYSIAYFLFFSSRNADGWLYFDKVILKLNFTKLLQHFAKHTRSQHDNKQKQIQDWIKKFFKQFMY